MKPNDMALQPSLKLSYLLISVSFFACVTLAFLPLLALLKIALILLVLLLSVYKLLRDVLLALPNSFQQLSINNKNEVILTQKNGKCFTCKVLPDSVVFPYVTILRLKLDDCFWPRSLILLEDHLNADELRHWRVWLKWGISWQSRSRGH